MIESQLYSICIVEDDEDDRHFLELVFSRHFPECQLTFFGEGDQLIEYIIAENTQPPSLLILDMNMPGLNGMETIEAIRVWDSFVDVPVVMLTTSSEEADRRRFLQLGGQMFVTKPLFLGGWVEAIRQFEPLWKKRGIK